MKVADLMTQDVKTCVASDTLDRSAHVMLAHDCGCVPVVDSEGRPVGIITDRDVCMAAFVSGRALHDIDVERTMTGRLVTCHADDSADDVLAVMRRGEVRRLPVVDDGGRMVGLVSLSDLTQAAGAERTAVARKREATAVFETLGVVSRPRDDHYFARFTAQPKRVRSKTEKPKRKPVAPGKAATKKSVSKKQKPASRGSGARKVRGTARKTARVAASGRRKTTRR